jgi:transposase
VGEKELRFLGIDTAEERHEGVLLGVDGTEEQRFACSNRRQSVEEALAKVMIKLSSDEELVIVLEAPRAHGRVVFEVVSRFGLTVIQVGTLALNRFREAEGQPRKDDHWDAYLAARMGFLKSKSCHLVSDPRPEERTLCRLTRTRTRSKDDLVRVELRLRSIMLELAPVVLSEDWRGPKPGSMAMRKILKKWPAFEGLQRAKRMSLRGIFRSCRYPEKKAREAIEAVKSLPGEIVLSSREREVVATEIALIIKQMELLESSIAELEQAIRVIVDQHPICRKLMEMPGVGLITAAVLVGELFPVMRNTTEASSATYAGLTPLARKSGKSLNRSRLARGSNKHVLNACFMSSVKSIQYSSLDRAYYEKKRADYQGHPKPHTAAVLALARQRHKVLYKLMTTDATYDKEKLISSHLARMHDANAA